MPAAGIALPKMKELYSTDKMCREIVTALARHKDDPVNGHPMNQARRAIRIMAENWYSYKDKDAGLTTIVVLGKISDCPSDHPKTTGKP